ncbi:MAG TPA: Uma2 family endonuclease [Chloroflexota bacterium]|nr:Uma2 family endonuclease [Chloroflexota bacterium]
MGTQWHQEVGFQLGDMLREVAQRRGASWGFCEWITLAGLQYADGRDYDPKPDVMVLRQPLASGNVATVHIAEVGVPLFIAEVASESTYSNDVGEKQRAYAAIGVPEYMVYDPTGRLLSERLRAWRLEGDVYVPWEAESDGWWLSQVLEVGLRPGQPFMRVRDRDGIELLPAGLMRQRSRIIEQERDAEARLRAVAERERDAEAQRRAMAEQERDAEAQRRAEVERRLAELNEMVRRLQEGRGDVPGPG